MARPGKLAEQCSCFIRFRQVTIAGAVSFELFEWAAERFD